MADTDDTTDELRRAAHAGAQLYEARRRFRRHAEEAMNALATAESELAKTAAGPIREAVTATGIAFAGFIAKAEQEWDEEEGFEYASPPDLAAWHSSLRNRLDDFRDGCLAAPVMPDFVECAFTHTAELFAESDPAAARRMSRLALSWGEDREHFERQPGWARRNGIIPGAETAPSLAALLLRFGQDEEDRDPRRACALRIGALAYRQLHAASGAYAQACCAEFVYASAIGERVE